MGAPTSPRLSDLLGADREPDSVVAWRFDPASGRDTPIRWRAFIERVDAVAACVRDWPPGPLILACEDRFAFAAGLFGAWVAGRLVLAPPNAEPDTLARLADRAAGLLGDRPFSLGARADLVARIAVLDPLSAPSAPAPEPESRRIAPDTEVLELFTSGTTGEGKVDLKCLAHLEEEVAYLDARWGAALAGTRMFSTASHQHLYGLLFGVLWPLCSGRAFQVDTLLHAAELFPRMRASGRCVLASVPSHLKRMVVHRDVAGLSTHCLETFSSGGPLAEWTADRWADALGEPPLEIFGSTETGGVAWRRQRPGDDRLAWTPFTVVECAARADDGCLHVCSPFVGVPRGVDRSEGFTMGDRARLLDDGRFLLLGRQDRVVKVAEKRVELPLMEQHLAAHAYLEDAAVLVLDQQGEARLGAVLQLSEAGAAFEAAHGRRALLAAINDDLAGSWDRVLLPRAWRVADRLPEDSQGKVTLRSLQALFVAPDPPREPQIIDERRSDERIVQSVQVPTDLAHLEGHFPGEPIVPGVVQVQWAVAAVKRLDSAAVTLTAIEGLKFRAPLRPGDAFTLVIERRPNGTGFDFALERAGEAVSTGRLRFGEEEVA